MRPQPRTWPCRPHPSCCVRAAQQVLRVGARQSQPLKHHSLVCLSWYTRRTQAQAFKNKEHAELNKQVRPCWLPLHSAAARLTAEGYMLPCLFPTLQRITRRRMHTSLHSRLKLPTGRVPGLALLCCLTVSQARNNAFHEQAQ